MSLDSKQKDCLLSPVNWQPQYSVGLEKIDNQHQKLFEMINNLHYSTKTGNIAAIIEKTIEDMASYVEYHFETEKSYLQHLPEFKTHEKEHWAFTKKTMQLVKEYRHNPEEVMLINLRMFLCDWLCEHIQGTDIKQFRLLGKK